MKKLANMFTGSNRIYTVVFGIMLAITFYKCYQTTHDLNWAYDTDFDRDMAFIHGNLEGNFGKDPNYLGQWLWYNPLLFSIETFIVKVTGLPANVVVTRAGVYLNMLAPLAFLAMLLVFFDKKIALGGMLAFLFLSAGKIPGWCGATYSPWLYPVCFVQFIFYLNLIFFYKAYSTGRLSWFLILGLGLGLSFLGHLAPTFIAILIITGIMISGLIQSIRRKDRVSLIKIARQTSVCAVSFLIAASPLLYYLAAKYHMHYVNRSPFEFQDNLTNVFYMGGIVKRNFSLALMVSLVGLWWFNHFFRQPLIRRIIMSWFVISLFLYLYSSLIPMISRRFHIFLPGTVPAFHYFFYLKSVQSVFFPFGLIFLLKELWKWVYVHREKYRSFLNMIRANGRYYALGILLIVVLDLPFYVNRDDFKMMRELAIERASNTDKIDIYNYIMEHIPSNQVILCEEEASAFPVMATERKMVSNFSTFSNPFTSYENREHDRCDMLDYLIKGEPAYAARLFGQYHVNYVLLSAANAVVLKQKKFLPGKLVYENHGYLILSVNDYFSSVINPILPRD
jgi:hypothetical protein